MYFPAHVVCLRHCKMSELVGPLAGRVEWLFACVIVAVFYSVLERNNGLGSEMKHSDYLQWGVKHD